MKRINLFAVERRSRAWFWWGISLGSLLVFLVWWWLQQEESEESGKTAVRLKQIVLPDDEAEAEPETPETVEVEDLEAATEPKLEGVTEDLQVIEGIGPRSAQALSQAGVTSFAKLAEMTPVAIQDLLRGAGVRVPFPETWPEQAVLAADGKWDELETLQDTLQGGRRV